MEDQHFPPSSCQLPKQKFRGFEVLNRIHTDSARVRKVRISEAAISSLLRVIGMFNIIHSTLLRYSMILGMTENDDWVGFCAGVS